ncbi:YceD family protein [Tanticharoenia sakaeratensis]|uniref:DUF177 domain-containing protein n=1 Tax=Tanticharoenia sakaeratensis NBRC 103193 TaxID=1231623 RepID=A0A0D6MN29_9PROT|nr:DUF177 domain-containing protein [Tanticharoenia sakaeratensis]GAN55089.1 hypothetical protein Tasa_038_070 [Tanticharoenia sakaeratensis NBRC 103193]GBQ20185.1 hypothetical protein AA103193_1294 [Tanticharoenia sakaeratensis NBRC 103193]
MSHAPELSRRFSFRRLAQMPVEEKITANVTECAALAKRFDLPRLDSLSCRFRLTQGERHSVLAEGWLAARVTQVSVISGEAFDDAVAETFAIRFVPRHEFREDDGVDLEAPDVLPYDNDSIDLGEVAAEQLGLALDPYPRMQGEGLDEAVDVVPAEDEPAEEREDAQARPNPFAALASRREGKH